MFYGKYICQPGQASQSAKGGFRVTYVLWASQSNSGDAWDSNQAEFGNGLAGLLLIARVDNGGGASWDGLSGLDLGVGVIRCFLLCHNVLGHLLVVQFFDAWVRHDGSCEDLVLAVVFFSIVPGEIPKLCGRHCSILAGRLFMGSQIIAVQKRADNIPWNL